MTTGTTTATTTPANPAVSEDPNAAFLRATDVINWEHPEVLALAHQLADCKSGAAAVARACFEWVRDTVEHCIDYDRDTLTCAASDVLRERTGYCYAKSHLLVALLRANGLPAGLCYQRLTAGSSGDRFVLHGLAAVKLPETGWYRCDPRGNKPGVDARFTPPVERLAYPIQTEGEQLFPGIYADPAPPITAALRGHRRVRDLRDRLPDVTDEAGLGLAGAPRVSTP